VAKQVAERLGAVRLAAVYSSPIERTWETAAEIARIQGRDVRREDGLLEVDYGSWSGRTLKSLYRLKAWRVVQQTPSRMVFPDGEGLLAAQARAVEAIERLAKAHRNAVIAAVTHADVIKAVVAHHLGTPLDLFQRIGVTPGSVSVIDLPTDGQPRVVAVNTNGDPSTWR
jgi:probable phosphoglycerate mutase